MTKTLRCDCGRPIRIVRLGRSILTLGHVQRIDHPVSLVLASRAGDGQTTAATSSVVGSKGIRRQPGTPERVSSTSDRARRRGGGAGGPRNPASPSAALTNGAAAD